MLIILLNIIPVFNDDRFGLFLKFIYLNSSCYIFVWCWFFLSLPIYRSLIDQMSVQIFFSWGVRVRGGSCNLDSSLLSILHVFCFVFFYFSHFWLPWSVRERHDLLSTSYVLGKFAKVFFFSAAETTSSYWFAVLLSFLSAWQFQMGLTFWAGCALKD